MDKKTLRNDLILIFSLLITAVVCLVLVLVNQNKNHLVAKVSVQNEVVLTIDLSKMEENDYYVEGVHGTVHIHTKDGAIAIVESNCPHQDCVRMGYVSTTNRPIICTYNAVYIIIEGDSLNDIEVK